MMIFVALWFGICCLYAMQHMMCDRVEWSIFTYAMLGAFTIMFNVEQPMSLIKMFMNIAAVCTGYVMWSLMKRKKLI